MRIAVVISALLILLVWTCLIILRRHKAGLLSPSLFEWLTSVVVVIASVSLAFSLDSYLSRLEMERAYLAEETRVLGFLDSYLDYIEPGFAKLELGATAVGDHAEHILFDSFPSDILRDAVASGVLDSRQALVAYKLADDIDLFTLITTHALQVIAVDPSLDGRTDYLADIAASLEGLRGNILQKVEELRTDLQAQVSTSHEENGMTRFEFWSLVVGSVAAAATFFAVIVALWGERIRQRWNRPKLTLSLLSPLGELNETAQGVQGRYYGLVVRNERASVPAENTRVHLTDVQTAPDGTWRSVAFTKPVQVSWRWPKITPPYIKVGPDEVASFLFLMKPDGFLQLQLLWCPNNLDPRIPPQKPTRLVFLAVSDTARSNELTIEVAWDGEWSEETSEMGRHLVVRVVTD